LTAAEHATRVVDQDVEAPAERARDLATMRFTSASDITSPPTATACPPAALDVGDDLLRRLAARVVMHDHARAHPRTRALPPRRCPSMRP
jgi:hypothetical protein